MVLAGLLWPLTNLVQTLPYLIGVIWILLAAFYDVSFVLQQSMFLCVYFYLTNVLERFLCFYLNVSLKYSFSRLYSYRPFFCLG